MKRHRQAAVWKAEAGEVHPLYGIFEVKETSDTSEKDGRAREFLQIDVLPIFL